MVRLYPYEKLFGPPILKPLEVTLYSSDMTSSIPLPNEDNDPDKRIITLWPENELGWQTAEVKVKVDLSNTNATQLNGEIGVTVATECGATQVRVAEKLSQTDSGLWEGEILLGRRIFYGFSSLKCRVSIKPKKSYPRYVGETYSWSIYFDEANSRHPRGAINSRWVHFRSDPEREYLRKYATEMYYLDLSGPEPVILLNVDFDGLRALFEEPPRLVGVRRWVAVPTALNIAKDVYTSLAYTALTELIANSDEDGPTWPITLWKQNILRMILPHMYPDLEEEELLLEVFEAFQSGDLRNEIADASAVICNKLLKEGREISKVLHNLGVD